jgi:hypothetical protein
MSRASGDRAESAQIPFDPVSLLPLEYTPMRCGAETAKFLTTRLRALSAVQRQVAYRAILDYRIRVKQQGVQQDEGRFIEEYEAAIAAALAKEKRETASAPAA